MSNGRPKVGHSNITYYAIQQRKAIKKPPVEKLPDPEPIQYESLTSIIQAREAKPEKDIFCPADLTRTNNELYYKSNQEHSEKK